jgi:hypothetical protein
MANEARKITVTVPARILDDAQRATGRGVTATVVAGLLELQRKKKRSALRALRGRVRFELDLDESRR